MSARKRHVFPTDRIAHLWFHDHVAQEHARNEPNNFYFKDTVIYSYGDHFPIATHLSGGQVLFTSRTYSVTTARHIGRVRQAITPGTVVFYADNPLASYADIGVEHATLVGKAREALAASKNKAQRVNNWRALKTVVANANAFASFAKLRARYTLPANAEELDALQREYVAGVETRRRERAGLSTEPLSPERQAQWREGSLPNNRLPYTAPTMLRIVGATVETSKGAEFPLDHARKAAAYLGPRLASGEIFTANGRVLRLGVFTIDSLDECGTLRAGCHIIHKDELEHFLTLIS